MENNKWSKVFGVVILTIIVSLITVKTTGSSTNSSTANIVYDKVVSSGTIRACYTAFPPAMIKDPNTGKLSGVFVETLNKAASNMGLKVDWVAEVGWGDAIQALNSNKCDIIGSSAWSNSTRGKSAEFAQSLYYSAINAYVRANDTRFDNDILVANNANYKLVTLDGETSQAIASQKFPNAKTLQLPQLTDVSQLFVNVADGKGDMTFQDSSTGYQYMKNNPGKIKNVSSLKPIVVYANVMMIKKGEFAFKSTIDNAIIELQSNGFLDDVITKYEKDYPGVFYRVAAPYVVSR
ncbi:MAG: transporter substrate-binding domain-containing protein [Candidatus Taylorbacteria bacterium]|nr:transporter substrate-binding domain-containing protein [Candidatus Taylorbacteria bacterium]